MQRGRLVTMTVIGLISMIAVGCGPDPKDLQIQQISEERDGLRDDLDQRDQMLQEAGDRDSYAQQTIDSLRGQMADLEGKLADASRPQPDADGWIGMPGFDMISIPGEVLFDSGKSALRKDGRRALDRIASDLRGQFSRREIYVFGHT
ncbi:MAG: hypothetical protein V3T70_03455, partial [Phycisphaerae bacterium]